MNTIYTLLSVIGLALAAWILWNLLEVIYRFVMIVVCTIVYTLLTAWEWAWFIFRWMVLVPVGRISRR